METPFGGDELCIMLVKVLDDQRAEQSRQEQLLRDALAAVNAANHAKGDNGIMLYLTGDGSHLR